MTGEALFHAIYEWENQENSQFLLSLSPTLNCYIYQFIFLFWIPVRVHSWFQYFYIEWRQMRRWREFLDQDWNLQEKWMILLSFVRNYYFAFIYIFFLLWAQRQIWITNYVLKRKVLEGLIPLLKIHVRFFHWEQMLRRNKVYQNIFTHSNACVLLPF